MAKEQMYTQCRLYKAVGDGSELWDEVWIPTELAVVGKRLTVTKKDTEPVPGWVVGFKGVTKSASWLKDHERDYLKQRSVSDI